MEAKKMGRLIEEGKCLKCSVCHRTVLKLVALNDDGSGKKMCRDCKRKVHKIKPLF